MKGLLDSNTIIYISKKQLALSSLFERYNSLAISRISYIEVLGYNFNSNKDEELTRDLIDLFSVFELDKTLGDRVVSIRKEHRIKLPDAIIAGTALHNGCELVTSNVADFKKIPGLNIWNPMVAFD